MLRGQLILVAKRHFGLLPRFGGHAAAAGVTLCEESLPLFEQSFEAIQFNFTDSAPGRIRAAYRLAVNEFNGVASLQLVLEHSEPA